jgi:hypothetical protein
MSRFTLHTRTNTLSPGRDQRMAVLPAGGAHRFLPAWRSLLRDWSQDWGGRLILGFGVYILVWLLWLVFRWGGPAHVDLINNLAFLPAGLVSAVLAWRASTHPRLDRRMHHAWRLLALAFLLRWLSDLLWLYYENILGTAPFPSWADAPYLSYYPVILVALLSVPVVQQTSAERGTFWLDAGTVMLSGGMLVWHLILRPTALAEHSGMLAILLALAYPVGDLGILFGVTALLLRTSRALNRGALNLLAAGLLTFFSYNLAFGYLNLQGGYASGHPIDVLLMMTLFLWAASGEYQYLCALHSADLASSTPARTPHVSLLPYVALVVGYGLLAIETGSAWTSDLGSLIVGGIALSGLVVARQVIAVRESEARKQQLLDYVEQVGHVTAAAAAVELGRFDPESLTGVAARPDALGQLARVFQDMAREVDTREQHLKHEVQELRIELDKGAVGRQVSEITETDYFQDLKKKAAQLRSRTDRDP